MQAFVFNPIRTTPLNSSRSLLQSSFLSSSSLSSSASSSFLFSVIRESSACPSKSVNKSKSLFSSKNFTNTIQVPKMTLSESTHDDIKRYGGESYYSDLTVHRGIVYTAGQVADDVSDRTVYGQTKQILETIDGLLASVGTDKSRILNAYIWLNDYKEAGNMNKAWLEWLDKSNKPTRATVEAKLVSSDYLVEIQVQAALPSKSMVISTQEAAAAVGPYVQGVRMENGLIFVSGCIGLKPDTMDFAGPTVEDQVLQAFCNMKAILKAAGATPSDVVKTMVLLNDMADFPTVNQLYKEFFGSGNVPARSTFAAKTLPKGALFEIECVAKISDCC